MQIITASINLSKVERDRIIEGKKGNYLNITIFVKEEVDEYDNDVTVAQSQSKEERDSEDVEPIYLGNGRVVYTGEGKKEKPQKNQKKNEKDDDLFG